MFIAQHLLHFSTFHKTSIASHSPLCCCRMEHSFQLLSAKLQLQWYFWEMWLPSVCFARFPQRMHNFQWFHVEFNAFSEFVWWSIWHFESEHRFFYVDDGGASTPKWVCKNVCDNCRILKLTLWIKYQKAFTEGTRTKAIVFCFAMWTSVCEA